MAISLRPWRASFNRACYGGNPQSSMVTGNGDDPATPCGPPATQGGAPLEMRRGVARSCGHKVLQRTPPPSGLAPRPAACNAGSVAGGGKMRSNASAAAVRHGRGRVGGRGPARETLTRKSPRATDRQKGPIRGPNPAKPASCCPALTVPIGWPGSEVVADGLGARRAALRGLPGNCRSLDAPRWAKAAAADPRPCRSACRALAIGVTDPIPCRDTGSEDFLAGERAQACPGLIMEGDHGG